MEFGFGQVKLEVPVGFFKAWGKFWPGNVDLGVIRTEVKIETMGMDGAIRENLESGKNQGPKMRYWSTPTC